MLDLEVFDTWTGWLWTCLASGAVITPRGGFSQLTLQVLPVPIFGCPKAQLHHLVPSLRDILVVEYGLVGVALHR